jgi:hypothetical protein
VDVPKVDDVVCIANGAVGGVVAPAGVAGLLGGEQKLVSEIGFGGLEAQQPA